MRVIRIKHPLPAVFSYKLCFQLRFDVDMQQFQVLRCIDKLFQLTVTVQHLQDTGVGRTVNALRKEPGDVGQAARALVLKWKTMVAAEESDQEGDHRHYSEL